MPPTFQQLQSLTPAALLEYADPISDPVWTQLARKHFAILPIPGQDMRTMFESEYCYDQAVHCQNHTEAQPWVTRAVALNNYNALRLAIMGGFEADQPQQVLSYAQRMKEAFCAPGFYYLARVHIAIADQQTFPSTKKASALQAWIAIECCSQTREHAISVAADPMEREPLRLMSRFINDEKIAELQQQLNALEIRWLRGDKTTVAREVEQQIAAFTAYDAHTPTP